MEIKHAITGTILWTGDAGSVRDAAEQAVKVGADLRDANLRDADLSGARIETGETWGEYLSETVPALLVAGGKSLADFKERWTCHEWSNCPMAFAFGVNSEQACPILLRPRVRQFVKFFDAKLIPWEAIEKLIDA